MPFVLEEGGRFGDHALALLSEIAEFGAQAGKLIKAPESWASSSPNAASAYWVRKWKQEVSGWLQVTMSDTLLRQTSRASVYGSWSSGPWVSRLATPTGLSYSYSYSYLL